MSLMFYQCIVLTNTPQDGVSCQYFFFFLTSVNGIPNRHNPTGKKKKVFKVKVIHRLFQKSETSFNL